MSNNISVLAAYAQDTGAFRATNAAASEIAEACSAALKVIEAMEKLFGADMEYCMQMDGKEDQLEAIRFAKEALLIAKGEQE